MILAERDDLGVLEGPTELARDKDFRCDDVPSIADGTINHPNRDANIALSEGLLSSGTGEPGREAEPSSLSYASDDGERDNDVTTPRNELSCFGVNGCFTMTSSSRACNIMAFCFNSLSMAAGGFKGMR
jgi:hypothetical protein